MKKANGKSVKQVQQPRPPRDREELSASVPAQESEQETADSSDSSNGTDSAPSAGTSNGAAQRSFTTVGEGEVHWRKFEGSRPATSNLREHHGQYAAVTIGHDGRLLNVSVFPSILGIDEGKIGGEVIGLVPKEIVDHVHAGGSAALVESRDGVATILSPIDAR